MAVTSTRQIVINFGGDQTQQLALPSALPVNATSPAAQEIKTFTGAGDNTVTVPTGGTTPRGVTIIPPAGNTQAITLKGIGADTGVSLHLTEPTSLGLATGVVNFVLTVAGTITGIRFVWT